MGINSCHANPLNFRLCINKRTNKSFKAQVLTENLQKESVVQGIEWRTCQAVIKIDGYADIEVGDYIFVPPFDDPLKAERIDRKYNEILFQKRKDYENFTSSTEVALS